MARSRWCWAGGVDEDDVGLVAQVVDGGDEGGGDDEGDPGAEEEPGRVEDREWVEGRTLGRHWPIIGARGAIV